MHEKQKKHAKDVEKLKKGESEFQENQHGILAVRWVDSKEVVMLTNCHDATVNQVQRKKKDGSRESIPCPVAILFYRKVMGGVDLADQMAGLYDLDRKSLKWWKKVIFRSLIFFSVNALVVFRELQRKP